MSAQTLAATRERPTEGPGQRFSKKSGKIPEILLAQASTSGQRSEQQPEREKGDSDQIQRRGDDIRSRISKGEASEQWRILGGGGVDGGAFRYHPVKLY